jgi:CRISPR system Cascade subunit CasE
MSELWLSRARLRHDTGATAALVRLLVPEGQGARVAAAHRLVWALFADAPDRERDFLWREEAPGRFMTLSARPPQAMPDLFDVQSKPFEPVLAAGDRLSFALCANAVVSRALAPGQRGKPHDVVMNALHTLPKDQRAGARLGAVAEAGRAWFARQGQAHGFAPVGDVGVDGYEAVRIPRDKGEDARFGRLDFTGLLQVTDPAKFLAKLNAGFGRARAFGCGLMLIRRA